MTGHLRHTLCKEEHHVLAHAHGADPGFQGPIALPYRYANAHLDAHFYPREKSSPSPQGCTPDEMEDVVVPVYRAFDR